MIYQNLEAAQHDLAKWQKRLRLQDWDVAVKFERLKDLDGQLASISYRITRRSAEVSLLDPRDVDVEPGVDHEQDLVHELVHLSMAFYDKEIEAVDDALHDRLHSQREWFVDGMANTLVELARRST